MQRISVVLALAALLVIGGVGYTLKLRIEKARRAHVTPVPQIAVGYEAKSPNGWRYDKDDPETGRPMVRLRADSAQATHDPSTLEIHGLALRLYNKAASNYTYVQCGKGFFDERSGLLRSDGQVTIMMNVPSDKDAENKDEAAKRVRVITSGVTYETKTGKASTDEPAAFVFPKGDGQAVGAEYDPNTKVLHLKSKVTLNWVGDGPPENRMHIESADLVYKEAEQKIYLTPSAKMQRQSTTIEAQNPVVTLDDGRLRQIVGDHGSGQDDREDRHTTYSADKMTGLFDDDGNLVNIIGENNARVVASEPGSRTTLTGNRADLRFAVSTKQQANGQTQENSDLHLVLADGHAVAESAPLPQPGVQLAETRILRSEHIELEMKPGGREVQEIRTSSQAQLEFKPNRADQAHRIVDCSRLRVIYGEGSYVDTFRAWNVATHTDKPVSTVRVAPLQTGGAPGGRATGTPPALTWSDEMTAKFTPNSNQVATIEQAGNFRYEEGVRKAWAKKALVEQNINRITLTDSAHVLDDTGSAIADQIVMNQANGDMNATGHVVSTHEPDRNQKPGTSMLDDTKAMDAQADNMQTRDNNTKVLYEGHAVMWQGANRISANEIDVDRDAQSLHAVGNVVSELVDNKAPGTAPDQSASAKASQPESGADAGKAPIFTIVRAPEVFYRDDTRIAHYTGGVKLIRGKMTVTSKELLAYLTPKSSANSDQSSLDHAVADGDVSIYHVVAANRTRTGTAMHCEYYTKENKVELSGGTPQMVDSYKGVTKGHKLTYYDDTDRLVVEGEKKQLAYTQMKKK